MNIFAVGTGSPVPLAAPGAAGGESQGSTSFTDILKEKLQQVDALQKEADAAIQGFVAGGITDVHEVMLATQRAQLALELTVQVRNKLVEAYQEVFRMQI